MPRVQATGADLEENSSKSSPMLMMGTMIRTSTGTAVAYLVLLALLCARVPSPGHRNKKAQRHLQQKVVLERERTFQSKPESQ